LTPSVPSKRNPTRPPDFPIILQPLHAHLLTPLAFPTTISSDLSIEEGSILCLRPVIFFSFLSHVCFSSAPSLHLSPVSGTLFPFITPLPQSSAFASNLEFCFDPLFFHPFGSLWLSHVPLLPALNMDFSSNFFFSVRPPLPPLERQPASPNLADFFFPSFFLFKGEEKDGPSFSAVLISSLGHLIVWFDFLSISAVPPLRSWFKPSNTVIRCILFSTNTLDVYLVFFPFLSSPPLFSSISSL